MRPGRMASQLDSTFENRKQNLMAMQLESDPLIGSHQVRSCPNCSRPASDPDLLKLSLKLADD